METLYVALWEAEKPMFKSYYVVWKPPTSRMYSMNGTTFKSYYVVWKQKSVDEKEIIEMSLNRTM